tara:strand:- start:86 stop:997 length:912 start_codon:yes stop_codon:yes gene_type:complete
MTTRTQNSAGPEKPDWLRIRLNKEPSFDRIRGALRARNLFTVCEEAHCPNINECWNGGTATFMIMGDVCTRGCRFCAVNTGRSGPPLDADEPENTARTIAEMGLSYIVITSVNRDDIPDQGAGHFAKTVELIKAYTPGILVETLTPDWMGNEDCIRTLAESNADVLAHNVETVERLQGKVRDPRANYAQSLTVLKRYGELTKAAGGKVLTKSSLMLGLGESDDEIRATMQDLLEAGVRVMTFGQYLRPTRRHLPVQEYVTPDKFDDWAKEGESMGFAYVASGPLVRSSYKAGEFYMQHLLRSA